MSAARRETQVTGLAMSGSAPLPYKRTSDTPNLGSQDSSDDIRGGMGLEGVLELEKFVRRGRHAGHRRIDSGRVFQVRDHARGQR